MLKKAKHTKKTRNFLKRVWNLICWPFKKIATGLRCFWNWLANINLVALLNLALLVSIIILFSLLIMDLRKNANAQNNTFEIQTVQTNTNKPVVKNRPSKARPAIQLPIKRDIANRKFASAPIKVAKTKANPVAVNQVATAKQKNILGDTVIDHHDMTKVLQNGTHIHGNLYIQDLRKYTLPCNIVIDGNLVLRDINLLNFCGDFTVRGNIYVNPRSSFGPIPSTARIGGQVIL